MGDSACLMHAVSYASALPNQSKQGIPMHALGESISFGRFTTESLSWDKWSTFSHKKYVEEAERYAQPGSVAQKKAFFEAYYKRIAAQKAAAALLEQQQNAAKTENEEQRVVLNSNSDVDFTEDSSVTVAETGEEVVSKESSVKRCSVNQLDNLENQETVSMSETSENTQIERPLLKNCVDTEDISSVTSKKKSGFSSPKTWQIPSTPPKQVTSDFKKENNSTRKSNVELLDEKRSSPKTLRALLKLGSSKEHDKESIFATKKAKSAAPDDFSTPFRTPSPASPKGASTPRSENKRMKPTIDPSASGRKTTGPKWHILSAVCTRSLSACRNKLQSPTVFTPFILRTEERAAKRKQKLEEKFNASEVQKMPQQKTLKEKAGNEFRKLSCCLCFKARPLPDFYKRETPKTQMKKTPAAKPQSTVLGRSISNKKQGTILMPPPPPPPMCLAKNSASKNLSKKNILNQSKFTTGSLPATMTHENASPNIQL